MLLWKPEYDFLENKFFEMFKIIFSLFMLKNAVPLKIFSVVSFENDQNFFVADVSDNVVFQKAIMCILDEFL